MRLHKTTLVFHLILRFTEGRGTKREFHVFVLSIVRKPFQPLLCQDNIMRKGMLLSVNSRWCGRESQGDTKGLSTVAILCLAIDILAYMLNSRGHRGRTEPNQKRISCCMDCHGFIAYTSRTITTYQAKHNYSCLTCWHSGILFFMPLDNDLLSLSRFRKW